MFETHPIEILRQHKDVSAQDLKCIVIRFKYRGHALRKLH